MSDSLTMKIALANAIAESLWLKGLLTDEELRKVKEKNAESLSLKK